LAAGGGFLELPERAVGLGHVAVEDGRVRADSHGAGDQLNRPSRMTALVVHDAE